MEVRSGLRYARPRDPTQSFPDGAQHARVTDSFERIGADVLVSAPRWPIHVVVIQSEPVPRLAPKHVRPNLQPAGQRLEVDRIHGAVKCCAHNPLPQSNGKPARGSQTAISQDPGGTQDDANVGIRHQQRFKQSDMLEKPVARRRLQVGSSLWAPQHFFVVQYTVKVKVHNRPAPFRCVLGTGCRDHRPHTVFCLQYGRSWAQRRHRKVASVQSPPRHGLKLLKARHFADARSGGLPRAIGMHPSIDARRSKKRSESTLPDAWHASNQCPEGETSLESPGVPERRAQLRSSTARSSPQVPRPAFVDAMLLLTRSS